MLNRVMLIGNMGQDAELKYTTSGKAVANFNLATTEKWKGQDGEKHEKTTWHRIILWGRQAETIKEYGHKGSQILIEGKIENRSYDDADGNKKYVSEVIASNYRLLGKKNSNGNAEAQTTENAPAQTATPPVENSSQEDDDDSDLPF